MESGCRYFGNSHLQHGQEGCRQHLRVHIYTPDVREYCWRCLWRSRLRLASEGLEQVPEDRVWTPNAMEYYCHCLGYSDLHRVQEEHEPLQVVDCTTPHTKGLSFRRPRHPHLLGVREVSRRHLDIRSSM